MGTTRVSYSHGAPSTSFYTEADQYDQDAVANTSRVRGYIRCVNDGNTSTFSNASGAQNGYINGGLFRQHTGTPFLPSGVGSGANRWYEGPYYVTVNHDANGNASYTVRQYVTDSVGTNDQTSSAIALTRIPEVPGAPSVPTFPSTTSSSITVNWTAGTRGHADITSYDITYADNAGFTSPTTVTSGTLSKVLSGLTPGKTYWVKIRATNSDGTGAYGPANSVFIGIAAKRWNGSAEVAVVDAVRWNGTAEVAITTAVRWNGTAEVPLS